MTSDITLTHMTLAEARDSLRQGAFTARELCEAHLLSVDQHAGLNAMITVTSDQALDMADAADRQLADHRDGGAAPGALAGIPVAVKDLFCTVGVPTTAGSHILDGFTPTYESTVTSNLWAAGAVMLGKTNLDEFAMGSSNLTSYYGPAVNPWRAAGDDRPRVTGGSSGGSAAAVAAHMALGSIGTDTGGSIRQPASFCGVVGVKPSYGRCSRWGVVAFASSLDHPGPFARTVRDGAIMLGAMAGFDPKDSTSVDVAVPDYEASLGDGVRGLKIGIPKEYRTDDMPTAIEALWQAGADWLKAAGAEIVEISLPHTKYALPAYYIIAPAEASSNLARYDGVRYGLRSEGADLTEMYENTRGDGFGAEVRRRVLIGTYVLSAGYYDAYYNKARRVRQQIADDFAAAFRDVDAILTPTTPNAAFPVDEPMTDPVEMYLNDVFTVPADLAGIPGISVPSGLTDDGLPLGLQVLAPAFEETTAFRVAQAIEDAADFAALPGGDA